MKHIKVEKTEYHTNSQGWHVVVKGRLVFVKTKDFKAPLKIGKLLPEIIFASAEHSGEWSDLLPIIISETEKINIGDQRYGEGMIMDTSINEEFSMRNNKGIWNKILALPENFSHKHLCAIVDGKLKDGQDVFVECEIKAFDKNHNEIIFGIEEGDYTTKSIFLDSDGHVKLFPVKIEIDYDKLAKSTDAREELKSWEEVFSLPPHYMKVEQIGFNGRGNHSVKQLEDIVENYNEVIHQLRVGKANAINNYNPPSKKSKP